MDMGIEFGALGWFFLKMNNAEAAESFLGLSF
jgi:hypothetical protein